MSRVAALLIIGLIVLFAAGFLPVSWATAGQGQSDDLNGTVPTRTPPPVLSHRTYLPILVRAH
ncbi:MAG: hypothetical protein WHX53_04835 [Anaerolineae bacterium]